MDIIEKELNNEINNGKKTICLNMIVKNEERIIVDTLTKLLKKIQWDYWVICDTGSTDKTREVIVDFFQSVNIPGEMISHEWKDFGYNRTEALKCAFNKTDYILIFDADDEICLDFKLPENLHMDAYNFQFGNHTDYNSYTRSLLVNNRKKWKFVGVLHEVIVPDGFSNTTEIINGDYFVVSGRCGDRNTNNPDKYLKDAKVLEKAYYEMLEIKDGLYQRYAFYCANSYFDYGDYENAIKWYKITLTHDNWWQEKYMCCYKIFKSYENLGQKETGFYYCVKSVCYDNERAECLLPLIVHYCCENMNEVAYSYYTLIQKYVENNLINETHNKQNNHKLFIDNSILNFHLPYYMVIVSEKTKHYDTGIRMLEIIFTTKQKYMSDFHVSCLLFNMQFFIDKIPQEKLQEFIDKLKEYVSFLEENGNKVYEYSFMNIYEKYGIELRYFTKSLKESRPDEYEKCQKSNKVLFYTGFASVPWNHTHSLTNALGGSETAVAYLTKFLPKNYEIYIIGDVEEEVVDNVRYVNNYNLSNLLKDTNFHTVVISRYVGFFDMHPYIKSCQTFIWVHDTVINTFGSKLNGPELLEKWNARIDGVVCLTEWHKQHLEHLYPVIRGKTHIINNGIKTEMFRFPLVKKPNSFIYTSCPERGLNRLLEIWSAILEKMPDAELNISTYVKFPRNEDEEKMKQTIESLQNVNYHGNLGPEQLYEKMSTSEYWLYPTDWPETSCITALEMLRSEVICIYCPLAGLSDTMNDCGIQIHRGQEVDTIMNLTPEKKQELRERGHDYADRCSWENRAFVWSEMMGLKVETPEMLENITLKIQELDNKVKLEDFKIKVVNMEKRNDRKITMTNHFKNAGIENYDFFKAVDGKEIEPSIEIKKLFEGNDFQYRRGVLGAALSHMKLWKELTDEPETCDFYIVLEDDVELCYQFKDKLKFCISEFLDKSMDRLYLGANSVRTVNHDFANLTCQKVSGEVCDGNYGYIISKSAAEKILSHFNKTSMKRAIDYTQLYHDLLENVYFVNESVIYTSSVQHHGNHVDSDIQKNYENVDISTVEDVETTGQLFDDYYYKYFIPQLADGITFTLSE